MLFVTRRARKSIEHSPKNWSFLPGGDHLEAKILMAIDLGGTAPTNNPIIATTPYGMDFGANTIPGLSTTIASNGAGSDVADVGDLNSDGFEDYAIVAPGTNGLNGSVSVVYGSATANTTPGTAPTTSNWIATTSTNPNVYTYTPNDRVGDLSTLGAGTQLNPITNTALSFPFAGTTFVNLTQTQAGFSSVAGVTLAGGSHALIIGAQDANGGTGQVYVVFGSQTDWNSAMGRTVDLSNPSANGVTLKVVTYTSSIAGGLLGESVAGGKNILGDGSTDIIMGAPAATIDGQTNTGAVFVVSTSLVPTTTSTVNVNTLGVSGTQSVVFAGVNGGDRAGFSVADAGDVNGVANVDDLLIGAPQTSSSAGVVYLIYGGSGLGNLATTTGGVRFINLNRVGITGTTAVPGATIIGAGSTDFLGSSISSAGDFNADGFSDILIGAPGFDSSATVLNNGAVYLLYGAPSTSSAYLTGTITLGSLPSTIPSVTLTGANSGDLAGTAVSLVGLINPGQPNPILIGAPGFNGSQGTAYLIPGRTGFSGTFSLANTQVAPLTGLQFVLTTPAAPGSPPLFGSSLSGSLQTAANTADLDNIGDFIIGSPGYITNNTNNPNTQVGVGGAQIVEGGLIKLLIPSAGITTNIGVTTPFAPFTVNTNTANLQIFVFGNPNTLPTPFMPVTDIDKTTVVVNGVMFPNATLQADPNPNDIRNGIVPAIITISPTSALGLTNGSNVPITISGSMLSTSPLFPQMWTGTALVTVTGGPAPPPFSGLAGVPTGPNLVTNFISPYGANQYTPSLSALSTFNYQPIPVSLALQQFLVPQGFRQRIYSFNHPGKTIGPYLTNRGQNKGRALGVYTLSSKVFDRSRFHGQRNYSWTHKGPKVGILKGVIPTQDARGSYDDNGIYASVKSHTTAEQ